MGFPFIEQSICLMTARCEGSLKSAVCQVRGRRVLKRAQSGPVANDLRLRSERTVVLDDPLDQLSLFGMVVGR